MNNSNQNVNAVIDKMISINGNQKQREPRVIRDSKRLISYSVRRISCLGAELEVAISKNNRDEIGRIRNRLWWHTDRIEYISDLVNLTPEDSNRFSNWIASQASVPFEAARDYLYQEIS